MLRRIGRTLIGRPSGIAGNRKAEGKAGQTYSQDSKRRFRFWSTVTEGRIPLHSPLVQSRFDLNWDAGSTSRHNFLTQRLRKCVCVCVWVYERFWALVSRVQRTVKATQTWEIPRNKTQRIIKAALLVRGRGGGVLSHIRRQQLTIAESPLSRKRTLPPMNMEPDVRGSL